jgi:hypothetical protein
MVSGKGVSVTNFSKDQLDKIRTLLDKVGVKPECVACKQGMMVLDRGQFGLKEVVQLRDNPTTAPGGTAGPTGRIATCVLFTCNSCGFVRMHSLAAIGLDNMM